jgi:hypothetical protein
MAVLDSVTEKTMDIARDWNQWPKSDKDLQLRLPDWEK